MGDLVSDWISETVDLIQMDLAFCAPEMVDTHLRRRLNVLAETLESYWTESEKDDGQDKPNEFEPEVLGEVSRDNTFHALGDGGVWLCRTDSYIVENAALLGRMTWAESEERALIPGQWGSWPCQTCVRLSEERTYG